MLLITHITWRQGLCRRKSMAIVQGKKCRFYVMQFHQQQHAKSPQESRHDFRKILPINLLCMEAALNVRLLPDQRSIPKLMLSIILKYRISQLMPSVVRTTPNINLIISNENRLILI